MLLCVSYAPTSLAPVHIIVVRHHPSIWHTYQCAVYTISSFSVASAHSRATTITSYWPAKINWVTMASSKPPASSSAAAVDAEVVIVGAGIGGLATALALRRVGVGVARPGGVLVLERHPELRSTGAALTIFPNGWFALRALGVAHKLTSRYDAFETYVRVPCEYQLKESKLTAGSSTYICPACVFPFYLTEIVFLGAICSNQLFLLRADPE